MDICVDILFLIGRSDHGRGTLIYTIKLPCPPSQNTICQAMKLKHNSDLVGGI